MCGIKSLMGSCAKAEMKLFVGVTNDDWFLVPCGKEPGRGQFLASAESERFQSPKVGRCIFICLNSPFDFIAGGGIFLKHTFLPYSSRGRRLVQITVDLITSPSNEEYSRTPGAV